MENLPRGLYDLLLTRELAEAVQRLDQERAAASVKPADSADSHIRLAKHAADILRRILITVDEADRPQVQAEICNEVLRLLRQRLPDGPLDDGDLIEIPVQRLTTVHGTMLGEGPPELPLIPLTDNDLLVNARGEPALAQVLAHEIESADRIDLLIAFLRWNGFRLVEQPLRRFIQSGKHVRVITTTYTGSTERRVLDHLVAMGAQVRVSYDTQSTRLHAKAWLFHRNSGFSTAFIGSSNLSTSALVEGLEWNVRLSQADAPTLIDKFRATFDSYWESSDYELYDPSIHAEKFDRAVAGASGIDRDEATVLSIEVRPWPHQVEMLEKLAVERFRHDRWRNLVVAATGTGKTVVAALDYRNLIRDLGAGRPLSLLFVAHRREILQQSRATFRSALRDGSFGELYVDGRRPDEWRHVFASVQSLTQLNLGDVRPDAFEVVVVDEFHHSAAPTYQRLLEHLNPRVLLGLTATPERADGRTVLDWFGGRIAVELRLWDALDRQLLAPFHYFGLSDQTDLSNVRWSRGRYDERELENLYTANDVRVRLILAELQRKVTDISSMRALGFCVGVSHARFMADRFNGLGIPSVALSGESAGSERDAALRKLKNREINCLFAVDIFNEGVDVPEIDTVLFLRPTESATVFLQQLGRGLRRTEGKDCLTALDFIGNANRNFRFDLRYRAITGGSRADVQREVEQGFPHLPAGCAIQLDRVAREEVLRNLKLSIGSRFSSLVAELRSMAPPITLQRFLDASTIDLEDLYGSRDWSWTRLKREAGHSQPQTLDVVAEKITSADEDRDFLNSIARLLHIDDSNRLRLFQNLLLRAEPPSASGLSTIDRRMLEGLLLTMFGKDERDIDVALAKLWTQRAVRDELLEVFALLEDRAEHLTIPLGSTVEDGRYAEVPIAVHARYSLEEIMAAFGRATLAKSVRPQAGVYYEPSTRSDLFFVTLEKSEKDYSPTTMYRDYAISPEEFHWESQSVTREASETGQRYVNHATLGSQVLLFVRRSKRSEHRTMPYTFLGPATYLRHSGECPMAIVWKLNRPMPLDFFKIARVAGG